MYIKTEIQTKLLSDSDGITFTMVSETWRYITKTFALAINISTQTIFKDVDVW